MEEDPVKDVYVASEIKRIVEVKAVTSYEAIGTVPEDVEEVGDPNILGKDDFVPADEDEGTLRNLKKTVEDDVYGTVVNPVPLLGSVEL